MKFNIANVVKIANTITNPKEAVNVMLDKMEKTNPGKAKMLRSLYASGKNPNIVLRESAEKGEITMEQLNELKSYYTMAKKLGLKVNIPNNVWKEAENAIKSAKKDNTFVGF